MKIVFMGNHTVGVIALKELLKHANVVAVFAYPDHYDDGNLYLSVKECAKKNNIPLFQHKGISDKQAEKAISKFKPDLIVTADYKYILKKEVFDIPKFGAINFHPSLLPQYRGRAPVNWAIINGEKKCGLTVHYIADEVDTGDIILQKEIEIQTEDTIKDIHDKLFPLYKGLTCEIINLFKKGKPKGHKQNNAKATTFPARKPDDGLIDWRLKAADIYNFVRAITYPYPGAFSFLDDEKYIIWDCHVLDKKLCSGYKASVPGQILSVNKDNIEVAARDGILSISKIGKDYIENVSLDSLSLTKGKTFRSPELQHISKR